MIYDCFSFFNELDLLEIRLNVLKDVVDRFVIAEATRTHRGRPKELLFEKFRERYAEFADKIIYIVVDDLLPEDEVLKDAFNSPWINENRQRNALSKGLSALSDDDLFMVSDLDEIPRPEAVVGAVERARRGEIVRFVEDVFSYFVNFKNYKCPKWFLGTQMLSMRTLRCDRRFDNYEYGRFVVASESAGHTMCQVRFMKSDRNVKNGGWHMGYLGGVNAIRAKLKAFAHSEASTVADTVEERLRLGQNIFGGRRDNFAIKLDQSFPSYLLGNQERFAHLIFPCDDTYMRRTWFARRMAWMVGAVYRLCVALIPKPLVSPLSKLMIRMHFR